LATARLRIEGSIVVRSGTGSRVRDLATRGNTDLHRRISQSLDDWSHQIHHLRCLQWFSGQQRPVNYLWPRPSERTSLRSHIDPLWHPRPGQRCRDEFSDPSIRCLGNYHSSILRGRAICRRQLPYRSRVGPWNNRRTFGDYVSTCFAFCSCMMSRISSLQSVP
jgi:hypothetical protein